MFAPTVNDLISAKANYAIQLSAESTVSSFKITKRLVKVINFEIRPKHVAVPEFTVSRLPKHKV